MAVKAVTIGVDGLEEFFECLGRAGSGQLKRDFEKFLEGLGTEFLCLVENEIIRLNVMDTRMLLNSFKKGSGDNVWVISDSGMQLEIGTNVTYASYVNDGHWTNKKGQAMRWVPGIWNGDRFVYTPGAKTGMLLKQKWIRGRHYFDSAIRIMERMMPELMERKIEQWILEHFGL